MFTKSSTSSLGDMTQKEFLICMRELFINFGWFGSGTNPYEREGKFCLSTAAAYVARGEDPLKVPTPEMLQLVDEVHETLCWAARITKLDSHHHRREWIDLIWWNDSPERKIEDIFNLLDRAINKVDDHVIVPEPRMVVIES